MDADEPVCASHEHEIVRVDDQAALGRAAPRHIGSSRRGVTDVRSCRATF